MELSDAIRKADQILDEERSSPTVKYSLRIKEQPAGGTAVRLVAFVGMLKEPELLQGIRSKRPREVQGNPTNWALESVNYNLLCAVLSQLREDSRQAFLGYVLSRLNRPPGCAKNNWLLESPWCHLGSEYPLIAEVCIRTGAKDNFLRVLAELQLFEGHSVLLRQLEDMICLNFTVLTTEDYEFLTTAATNLANQAGAQMEAHRKAGPAGNHEYALCYELHASAKGIQEECRRARYFYLKTALLEGFNLEINQDKATVESYLKTQGFSDALIGCLNRADEIYQRAASGFDFKTCMSHLRSFVEQLHSEGITKLSVATPESANHRWGDGLTLLRKGGVLSKAEEGYASALYTLVSDEGVHPVIAEKEYARLGGCPGIRWR